MQSKPSPTDRFCPVPRLRDLGEDQVLTALLARIRSVPVQPGLIGPGDDCAVIPLPDSEFEWLLTSDPVIEGVHFLAETDPHWIGHKAIARAISDIAAMGGTPLWNVVNVTAPSDMPLSRLEAIYDGANEIAAAQDAYIIGGDIGTGRTLALHVFAIGQTPIGTAVLRRGARPGDTLFVTGALGGSLLGHHLRFTPRVQEGEWLRSQGWATAMMDISDGISTDIRRMLAASQVGADLDKASIPISPSAYAMNDALSPLAHALNDGEDFELLFTVAADRTPAFQQAWANQFDLACTAIGRITEVSGQLRVVDDNGHPRDWSDDGYLHFHARECD